MQDPTVERSSDRPGRLALCEAIESWDDVQGAASCLGLWRRRDGAPLVAAITKNALARRAALIGVGGLIVPVALHVFSEACWNPQCSGRRICEARQAHRMGAKARPLAPRDTHTQLSWKGAASSMVPIANGPKSAS